MTIKLTLKYKFILIGLFSLVLLFPLTCRSESADDLWLDLGLERLSAVDVPTFTLEDVSGKKVSLESFKGRVVFLNFWATWCPPCKEEMPAMDKLHRLYEKKGLSVVAINDYQPKKNVLKYLKNKNFAMKILIDEKGGVSEAYHAGVLPMTFLIDRDGKAVGRAAGFRDWTGPSAISIIEEVLSR
ncbi:MAG: redoxin domain-containing protein [Deltaproteobacteria bacterium]|nr:redoxin domain-containing protein [Deltaproteobacteria bacterium]